MRIGIFILCLLALSANAAGPEILKGDIKQITCVAPTAREDGTVLLLSELLHTEVFITQDQAAKGIASIANTECMLQLDTTDMAVGQWWVLAVAVDTGGRKSKDSVAAPFLLITLVSIPMPPSSITIQ